jgi:sulfite reductase (NADPH) hemoprotein beta-component
MSWQIVTANRLVDGAVVYRGADGRWTTRLSAAAGAADQTAAKALLEAAQADAAAQIVVAPYLVEVEGEPGNWQPKSWKERIRSQGPTIPHDFTPDAEPRLAANGEP